MAMHAPAADIHILAVDPTSKGIGFVVLEGRKHLIDWGVKSARGEKNETCLLHVASLLDRYRPDVLLIEEHRHRSSRRSARVRALLGAIARLARGKQIRVSRVSRRAVRAAFASAGASTKHQIATVITLEYKELGTYLPRRRKPWMSEDERMGVFNAVSFALAHLGASQEEHRSA